MAPSVQGRVFAARGVVARVTVPLSMVLAGPLADRFFEPGMVLGGALADSFEWLVGTGPGRGMALMFVISGVMGAATGLGGYVFRVVRDVEDIISDHVPPSEMPSSPKDDESGLDDTLEDAE